MLTGQRSCRRKRKRSCRNSSSLGTWTTNLELARACAGAEHGHVDAWQSLPEDWTGSNIDRCQSEGVSMERLRFVSAHGAESGATRGGWFGWERVWLRNLPALSPRV